MRNSATTLGVVRQVREPDAEGAGIGERQVGFARLREVGEDLEGVADIQDDDEGRILVTRQGADVALGLAARLQHRLAPSIGAAHGLRGFSGRGDAGFLDDEFQLRELGSGFLKLLRFEDEAAALVEVNAARRGRAVGVVLGDRELEGVTGVRVVVRARD